MQTRRGGFTLVEMLIVSVIAALAMAAVYQSLMVQEQSYRAGGAMIRGQDAVRTAIGVLESELREIGTIGGATIAGTDLLTIAPDEITFRAQRKLGFVCTLSRNDKWAEVWSVSDAFEANDQLLVFVDNDSLRFNDDEWRIATVSNAQASSHSACVGAWDGTVLQRLRLDNSDLTGVRVGAAIRSFDVITYGLYDFGPLGWGLGRQQPNQPLRFLVGGLADPKDGGLIFRYFDRNNQPTSDPTTVARIEIEARTRPEPRSGVPSTTLDANLFLRNN